MSEINIPKLHTRIIDDVPVKCVKPASWMTLEGNDPVIDVTYPENESFLQASRRAELWPDLYTREEPKNLGYTPQTIGVVGPSGGGKDVVTAIIEQRYGNQVMVISADNYYGPGGKCYYNNYDHPNSVDWALLIKHLEWLKQGCAVNVPRYNFADHSRSKGFNQILAAPIILIQGIMIAEKLHEWIDLMVGVYAPWEICVDRRIQRDIYERGRTRKQCEEQIADTVRPGYEKFVEPHIRQIKAGTYGNSLCIDNSTNQINDPILATNELFARIDAMLK